MLRRSGWPWKPIPNTRGSRGCASWRRHRRGSTCRPPRVVGDVGLHGHADVALGVGEAGEHLGAGFAAGIALFDLGAALRWRLGRVVLATTVRRRHPVDCRQVPEVVEPGRLQRLGRRPPRTGGDADPQVVVRHQVRVDEPVADVGRSASMMPSRRPSPGGAAGAWVATSASLNPTTTDDDRRVVLATPLGAHVLVLDPLLEQHDAFEQRFRTRGQPGT